MPAMYVVAMNKTYDSFVLSLRFTAIYFLKYEVENESIVAIVLLLGKLNDFTSIFLYGHCNIAMFPNR